MHQREWIECTNPLPMLGYLSRISASDRKRRLFAVACSRQVWGLLPTNECRRAIEISERFADESNASAQLREAIDAVWYQRVNSRTAGPEVTHTETALEMVCNCCMHEMNYVVDIAKCANRLAAHSGLASVQCSRLLRDIFGNPFRPVTLDPAWLRWNGGLIRHAAQRIYDERSFDDLPILGDALEDAGCRDAGILEHCRRPGEHVRGCWVVDLLLGKS